MPRRRPPTFESRVAEQQHQEYERKEREERSRLGNLYWPRFVGYPAEETLLDWLRYFTPESVIEHWRREIESFGLGTSNPLRVIPMRHSRWLGIPDGRYNRTAWWPKNDFDRYRETTQAWFDRHVEQRLESDFVVLSAPDHGVKGPRTTVGHLLHATTPEQVAAVFLSASLFYRTNNRSHGSRGNDLPPSVPATLLEWMHRIHFVDWQHVTNQTLCVHDHFNGTRFENTDGLIQHLAIEAAKVLHCYVPVVVAFVGPEANVGEELTFGAIPELEQIWEHCLGKSQREAIQRMISLSDPRRTEDENAAIESDDSPLV